MSITKEFELLGMKKVSDIVVYTLKEMKHYARLGMTTTTAQLSLRTLVQTHHHIMLTVFPDGPVLVLTMNSAMEYLHQERL